MMINTNKREEGPDSMTTIAIETTAIEIMTTRIADNLMKNVNLIKIASTKTGTITKTEANTRVKPAIMRTTRVRKGSSRKNIIQRMIPSRK